MAEPNLDFSPQYSILTIDGGGIKGILPCRILMYIEDRLKGQVPLADLFDLIAGTSTGGILACGLTVKGENGKPKFKAADLIELYTGETGRKIFSQPNIGSKLNLLRNTMGPKFPSKNIEEILKEKFGEARLSEAYTDLFITAYDIEQKTPFYFKSSDAARHPEIEDFPLWEISRSTSAAPTYFPPYRMPYTGQFTSSDKNMQGEFVNRKLSTLSLIDGGVFANNPSLLAYIEAKQKWKETPAYEKMIELFKENMSQAVAGGRGMVAEVKSDNYEAPFLMLSLGTGQSRGAYPYKKAKKWGMLGWTMPIVDILMQGVSESVDYQMKHLLPPYDNPENTPRYVRINTELAMGHEAMDDASEEATDRLMEYAEKSIENNKEKLDQVVNILAQMYKRRQKEKGV